MLSFWSHPETVESVEIGVLRRRLKRRAGLRICSLTAHSTLKCGQKAAKNALRSASKSKQYLVRSKKLVCPRRDSNPQPFP